MKAWMVEQRWCIGGNVVPVRSVVNAKSKNAAERGAAESVLAALRHLTGRETPPGEKRGEPVVLYSIGPVVPGAVEVAS